METESIDGLSPSGLETHLGYWLRMVSNRVSGGFITALRGQQTSAAEWVLLRHLYDLKEATPGELAERLGMTRGAVSKIVDKLEAKEWIASRVSAEDNRVLLLSLTRKGSKALPKLAAIADRNDAYFFDCLTAHEQATLRKLLGKLADHHQIRNSPIE